MKSNFVGHSTIFWRDVAVAKKERGKKRKGKHILLSGRWRVSYVNENGTRMSCLGPLGYTKLKYARHRRSQGCLHYFTKATAGARCFRHSFRDARSTEHGSEE